MRKDEMKVKQNITSKVCSTNGNIHFEDSPTIAWSLALLAKGGNRGCTYLCSIYRTKAVEQVVQLIKRIES